MAPGSERGLELVRNLIFGPKITEQGVEVACGFNPLLACEGFQLRAGIKRA